MVSKKKILIYSTLYLVIETYYIYSVLVAHISKFLYLIEVDGSSSTLVVVGLLLHYNNNMPRTRSGASTSAHVDGRNVVDNRASSNSKVRCARLTCTPGPILKIKSLKKKRKNIKLARLPMSFGYVRILK